MYSEGNSDQKAIQCVYQDKSTGQMFELQFHTVNSQGVKEINHPLYEKARAKSTSVEEQSAINKKMRTETAVMVNDPPNVDKIKKHP